MTATPRTHADFRPAARLSLLPTYLFERLDRAKAARRAAGADLIDMGTGDPDRPTPEFIVSAMRHAIAQPDNHRYPNPRGSARFREAAARFLERRFRVRADPERHILACVGSKEGIAHLPLAVADPDRTVLCPSLAYPVYHAGAVLAGARPVAVPMREASGWTPVWEEAASSDLERAALVWVNYPNNPTAASVDTGFFARAQAFAADAGAVLASDQAYSELYYEDQPPPSLWQAHGADLDATAAIEFHSLSKTFNMTGWRIAFAVGRPDIIDALAKAKGPIDSGPFTAVQDAAVAALENFDHPDIAALRAMYRQRRDALCAPLRAMGLHTDTPRAGMFVWARCPVGGDGEPMDSWDVATAAIERAGVCLAPGAGFGEDGRHFIRFALTAEADRVAQAVDRLGAIRWAG